MKKLILLISVLVVVFMVPICSYADCGQDCSRKCDPLGSGREWAACMEKCMKGCYYKPIPTPEIAQIGEPMILAQIPEPNCVCAECGKKCGTGHETWCSSYRKPKAKPDAETQKAITLSFSESCEENTTGTFLLALGGKLCCVEGGKVIGKCHELTPYYNPFDGECYVSRDDCKNSGGGYDVCIKCTTPCK